MVDSILQLGERDSIYHRRVADAFTEYFDDPDIVIYSANENNDEYTQIFENESFAETVIDERLDSWPPEPPDIEYLEQFEAEYGTGTLWRCLSADRSLVKRGRLVTCGATAGPSPETDVSTLFWNQLDVLGSTMGTPGEVDDVLDLVWDGTFEPQVRETLPMSEASSAHRLLEEREGFGKVVVVPDSER